MASIKQILLLLWLILTIDAKDIDYILLRPSLYFGLQTQSKTPIFFGLMWNNHYGQRSYFIHLRETAQYSDSVNMKVIRADGLTFSKSTYFDSLNSKYLLNVTYVKPQDHNDAFAVKIQAESLEELNTNIAIYLYIGTTDPTGILHPVITESGLFIEGSTAEYGSFRLKSFGEDVRTYYYGNKTESPYLASDNILPILKSGTSSYTSPACCLPMNHENLLPDESYSDEMNLVVLQRVLTTPFEWSVSFENTASPSPIRSSKDIDNVYELYEARFSKRFELTFPVRFDNGTDWSEFSKQTLSSLLFGLSFFSGTGLIQDPSTGKITELPDRSLLTLIPAKVAFPRGFYWDEAFHQMLMIRWDAKLAQRIATDWHTSSICNETTGWIAREQVLGTECRTRAPSWAWPGQIDQMNPPVYFLTMQQYLHLDRESAISFFKTSLYSRLQNTYNWYMTHCMSKTAPFVFVWNGRKGDSSLDSGLDDFPRHFTFVNGEINIDLQSWMAKISLIMSEIADAVGDVAQSMIYINNYRNITQKMTEILWSESHSFYVDYSPAANGRLDHIGFPGMLPLCLGTETNKTRLEKLLTHMSDKTDLLDNHGWLSLSQRDSKFSRRGNYWRGNLWVNQQYLCCQGLYYYEKQYRERDPSLSKKMFELRKAVQKSLIKLVYDNYFLHDITQGGIYETYHPFDGKGYNNVPFSGWSALVVLMISEDY
jgi:mannosyl-oligosaccharide glucosidase